MASSGSESLKRGSTLAAPDYEKEDARLVNADTDIVDFGSEVKWTCRTFARGLDRHLRAT